MTKKQVLSVSLVAAIPAALLLYVLVMAAVNHGNGVFAGLMWLFWGLAVLGGAFLAVLPVLVQIFYPAQGFLPAAASSAPSREIKDAEYEDDELEDDEPGDSEDAEEFAEEDEAEQGEQMFDEDALEDEFDEFEGDFGDDDKKKR